MSFVLKFFILVIIQVGLILTLFPRLHGTVVILIGAVLYGAGTAFATFSSCKLAVLGGLAAFAEGGCRLIKYWLVKNQPVTPAFSVNSLIGNTAGIIAADALFGPLTGAVVWELAVGKTWFPRIDTISKVLLVMAFTAAIRFLCGLAMAVIIIKYLFV